MRIESAPAEFALILGPGFCLHLFRSLHIKCSRDTIFWFLSDRNLNKMAFVEKLLVCITPRKTGVRNDFKDPWHLARWVLCNLHILVFILAVQASECIRGQEAGVRGAWQCGRG